MKINTTHGFTYYHLSFLRPTCNSNFNRNTNANGHFSINPANRLSSPHFNFRTTIPSLLFTKFAFPESVDTTKHYLFYIHGRVIEEQGIPAVDPVFGEYEYRSIFERLSSYGFVVISEQRSAPSPLRQTVRAA